MSAVLTSARAWIVLGAALSGSAVAFGAYGWHALEADAAMREIFLLGVQYQMWHGLALFVVAWLCGAGGVLFVAGTVLFPGNLYAMAGTGEVMVYGGAPAGGFALMAGWALLAVSGLLRRRGGPPP
ncbi:MAG: DUF423 domain-containing protein [Magnetovibrio sp.]|nr:DUF423 domain-containing protein [Magnetovibrio sp.]